VPRSTSTPTGPLQRESELEATNFAARGKGQDAQKIATEAKGRLASTYEAFIAQWLTSAHMGAQSASKPDDPIAKANFYRALAGNLVWAATCFLPGGIFISIAKGAVALRVASAGAMAAGSLGGAAVGSGVGKNPNEGNVVADAEALVRKRLGVLANGYRAQKPQVIQAAATKCGQDAIEDPVEQDKALWGTMFDSKGYPYDEGFTVIQEKLAKTASSALASFVTQWQDWKRAQKECMGVALVKHQRSLKAFATPFPDFAATQVKCDRDIPFTPKLEFSDGGKN
jgi:hypothetical protein